MRRILSFIVMLSFAFAAVSAQAGQSFHSVAKPQTAQLAIQIAGDELSGKEADTYRIGLFEDSKKKPCSCKDKHGPAGLVCGVALALTKDASHSPPSRAQLRFSLTQTGGCSSVVYRLKRPPRTAV